LVEVLMSPFKTEDKSGNVATVEARSYDSAKLMTELDDYEPDVEFDGVLLTIPGGAQKTERPKPKLTVVRWTEG
jgi:hypothetical protein